MDDDIKLILYMIAISIPINAFFYWYYWDYIGLTKDYIEIMNFDGFKKEFAMRNSLPRQYTTNWEQFINDTDVVVKVTDPVVEVVDVIDPIKVVDGIISPVEVIDYVDIVEYVNYFVNVDTLILFSVSIFIIFMSIICTKIFKIKNR